MGKKAKRKDKRAKSKPIAKQGKRLYAGSRVSRLVPSVGNTSSADAELYGSLRVLRNRSRQLVRDEVYAKRARTVVVNNVVGKGVGLQGAVAQARGRKLHKAINAGIERAWSRWCAGDSCHTGGALHFGDLERLLMAEIFEAGEVFVRLHFEPFGRSRVPIALEVIEAERLADDHEIHAPSGARVDLGIEVDAFDRPLAYYFHSRHPNEMRPGIFRVDEIERVEADQVMHLRLVDRWPQKRGVPWMHAAIVRLHQMGKFENAALTAAVVGASKLGFFVPTEWAAAQELTEQQEADGTPSTNIEAGEFTELPPGYSFEGWDPQYPHENYEPFMRASLRGFAAGADVSYEAVSRDYSQSNYSSSRLAQLDDRDLWRVLQAWWIRTFREPLHRLWLQRAVLVGAIPEVDRGAYMGDPERFEAVRFKPRGWSWVDPPKEVAAYKEAERAGYLTKADVIAQTAGGADLEDVIEGRRLELDALAEAGISTDTTEAAAESAPPAPAQTDGDDQGADNDDERARLRAVRGF